MKILYIKKRKINIIIIKKKVILQYFSVMMKENFVIFFKNYFT